MFHKTIKDPTVSRLPLKKKRNRMMTVLRQDLMNRSQLKSFKVSIRSKYSASLPALTSHRRDIQQSYRSLQKQPASRLASVHYCSSSSDTDDTCLSTTDLRKVKILQTLIKMGVQLPPKHSMSKEELAQSDEKKVLKYMANSSRRGSLTARTLASFQRQTSYDSESGADDESDSILPAIPTDRKKFASKARALSWLHGRGDDSNSVSPEPVKINRRKRKKQNNDRFKKLTKFLILFFRSWKIHATRKQMFLYKHCRIEEQKSSFIALYYVNPYENEGKQHLASR
ncbi:hypothetical protein LOTGIDRAFT_158357 [Lottia gigantea]|uniref:Uncharacterized protein n=1 Tax=Lottia gigantea TaxID=225164 RepID=V4AW15_LOTGI|nr:hypothetical protein LOTGIDRAFT_158357 [Lottia gigantea]ESO99280.1 hypothetical protein LOTGIDRAFT_158357 [Lottia gigantea]